TAQELVTASVERIPIKVGILNNSYLGMVRQWQEMFYDERYSEVYLSPELPDFVKWAEAMGCVGIRVDSPEEVQPAIDKANSVADRPVVVDFRVESSSASGSLYHFRLNTMLCRPDPPASAKRWYGWPGRNKWNAAATTAKPMYGVAAVNARRFHGRPPAALVRRHRSRPAAQWAACAAATP